MIDPLATHVRHSAFRNVTGLAVVILALIPASEVVAQPQSPGRTPNQLANAISGHWVAVPEMQKVLDDISPNPDYLGRLDSFEVGLIDMRTFWSDRELKQVEEPIKQLASDRKHRIVTTGEFGGGGERQPMFGFFMLTHKDGESFLSVLNIDEKTFVSWPLHYIAGKTETRTC